MSAYTSADMRRLSIETLQQVLDHLSAAGLGAPAESGESWAKWPRSDGGLVIFRANYTGDWGTLDVYWRENGFLDHLFAPRTYDSLDRLARDVRIALGPFGRAEAERLGKR